MEIVEDANASVSPPSVLRWIYPEGLRGGSTIGFAEKSWSESREYDSLYLAYSIKPSEDFIGGARDGINQFQDIWLETGGGSVERFNIRLQGYKSDPLDLQIRAKGDMNKNLTSESTGNSAIIKRGEYSNVEILLRSNVPGESNGVVKVWLDGRLVINYTSLEIVSPEEKTGRFTHLEMEPTWSKAKVHTTSEVFDLKLDHLYMSGAKTRDVNYADSVGASAAFVEDFSTYNSTSEFLNDPRDIYLDGEDEHQNNIKLDQSLGYGSSDQSMRYDYPDVGANCLDYTISRSLDVSPEAEEIWVEWTTRFGKNFSFIEGYDDHSCLPGMKYLHLQQWDEKKITGRFGVGIGHPGIGMKGPADASCELSGETRGWQVLDGEWHTYRVHVKTASVPGNTSDAVLELWVDGKLQDRMIDCGTAADGVWGIALARNINFGPVKPQSLWWGEVKYYTEDPGW